MRNAILVVLLVVLSSNTLAEWVEIDNRVEAKISVDPATLQWADNRAKIWVLFDFKTARKIGNNPPILSMKSQFEFDCKNEQSRLAYNIFHAENSGLGEVVHIAATVGAWTPIAPQSVEKGLFLFVCKKS